MRIIAVMSPKGGIGKTTTSDAIAYMLGEEQEKRVLILDGDPQGDTSKTFEAYEPEGTGMSELLERHVSVGGSYRTTDLIRPTQYSHIDIIPANGYLMQTDMKLLLKQEANQVTRLRDALEEISEAYDYCICDCGRLLDMVVINILLAAELVIAPVKVGGYENEAIHNLQEQVDDLREINEKYGEDRGAYFIERLNLKRLQVQSNSYDFATRLIPIGKDGLMLNIDGKNYVENHQYSKKVKTMTWKDERYTDAESLKEDAEAKLDELSKPYRSYTAEIINLVEAVQDEEKKEQYKEVFSIALGDTVLLISKSTGIRESHRIVKFYEYPLTKEKNKVELANTRLSFEEVQRTEQELS